MSFDYYLLEFQGIKNYLNYVFGNPFIVNFAA
jgi:hypothetical protein